MKRGTVSGIFEEINCLKRTKIPTREQMASQLKGPTESLLEGPTESPQEGQTVGLLEGPAIFKPISAIIK